eukprot:jgi/Chlat1/1564/Chrsp123S01846
MRGLDEQQQQGTRPAEGNWDPTPERLARVEAIADQICALSLLEVAELTQVLRVRLKIDSIPIAGGYVSAPGAGGAAEEAPAEEPVKEKTEFDVKLEKFDTAAKIKVIKEVRAVTSLGLKEAKELVESAPAVVKKGIKKDEAEAIMAKLAAVGATCTIE